MHACHADLCAVLIALSSVAERQSVITHAALAKNKASSSRARCCLPLSQAEKWQACCRLPFNNAWTRRGLLVPSEWHAAVCLHRGCGVVQRIKLPLGTSSYNEDQQIPLGPDQRTCGRPHDCLLYLYRLGYKIVHLSFQRRRRGMVMLHRS